MRKANSRVLQNPKRKSLAAAGLFLARLFSPLLKKSNTSAIIFELRVMVSK
jgi:hypothetical protein